MRAYAFARAALAAAVSSLVFVTAPAHAQRPEGTRLTADAVAQLAAAPDVPGARVRLREHFLAVAGDYDARAREHRAMAEAYRRTPTGAESKRPASLETAVHCDRLADRATEAATEARALAAAYAGSTPVAQTSPTLATETAGAAASSADVLETAELRRLVQEAPTSESHARLERHYLALATRFERDANQHRGLAVAYRAEPTASESKRPGAPDTAVHCERLAERVSRMAAEARGLAARHGEQRRDR